MITTEEKSFKDELCSAHIKSANDSVIYYAPKLYNEIITVYSQTCLKDAELGGKSSVYTNVGVLDYENNAEYKLALDNAFPDSQFIKLIKSYFEKKILADKELEVKVDFSLTYENQNITNKNDLMYRIVIHSNW